MQVNYFLYSELEHSARQGSLSEVGLHVGQHLGRAGRGSRGVGKLGRIGELQLLQSLYVLVAQGQELHVTLLHGVRLLLLDSGVPPNVVIHPKFQVTHAGNWI